MKFNYVANQLFNFCPTKCHTMAAMDSAAGIKSEKLRNPWIKPLALNPIAGTPASYKRDRYISP